VEMLLQLGVPDGGPDRDGGLPVLLREGTRPTHGILLMWAPSLLRAGGDAPQAQLHHTDCHLHSSVRGVPGHHACGRTA
jgi:hypothetical protein